MQLNSEDMMVEEIKKGFQTIAIVLKNSYKKDGISFFTPNDFSQQLAYMKHQKGTSIQAHVHNAVERSILKTQEVIFLRKGRLRVDLYDDNQQYLESRIMESGDVILLAAGGHGFEALEEVEMVEVKQGPYSGELDKTRFTPVEKSRLVIK